MLDQQFFANGKYADYLTENFVAIHAMRMDDSTTGEKARGELFDQFGINATPTVMIATTQGEEIDRLVGFTPALDTYKKELEEASKGRDTKLALLKALKKDPNNPVILVKLARKYQFYYDFKTMREYGDRVLAQPKARKIKVKLRNGKKVSAYEYAKFTQSSLGPEEIAAFLNEFPKSPLRTNAIQLLSNFFYQPSKKQATFETYRELYTEYPDDPELLQGYAVACGQMKTDVDQGIAAADKYYQDHPGYFSTNLATAYAELLLSKGEDEKAMQVYGQAEADKYLSKSAAGLNEYAWFWALKGKNLASAETAARQSLKLQDEANTWDTLSMVLWKQGKHAEAITAEEKALQLAGGKNEDFEKRIQEIKEDMNKK